MNSSEMGVNHQSVKIKNKSLVLKKICTEGQISRIELARQTGLSKMSVTNIVNELIQDGFVTEQDEYIGNNGSATVGRKPVCITPNPDIYVSLGIYISRDYAIAIATTLNCKIIIRNKCLFSFDESENSFLNKINGIVSGILESDELRGKKVLGIGISCIGPLDIRNGIILEPPNFYNLREIRICEFLEKKFGYKAYIDNDMNASALAEKLFGRGKVIDNFIYVGVTNGIGAGIIANGELYQGQMGFSGEIGHSTIHFDGPKCSCGNIGCLELYASIPVIVSQARQSISVGVDSKLRSKSSIEWSDIVECALQGDDLSVKLIDRLCMYVSIGLTSLSNIFDPEVIYIGHDIAVAEDLVKHRIEENLNERILGRKYRKIFVEISAFRDQSPLIGSSVIILDKLFNAAL